MSQWNDLYPSRHTTLDINTSYAGWLTMIPSATAQNGWYSENEGPLYYRNLTGNFVVETSVTLGTATNRMITPTVSQCFCQAGFVLRDATSAQFNQRWIMYNMGFQDMAVAREIKTTVPSLNGTSDSLSTLNLNDITGSANTGRLRVCRIGSVFRFFHRHPAEANWVEETFTSSGASPTRVFGNGPRPNRADGSALSFDRPDLPATIQIGLYVGNYVVPMNGVRGEFDYFRVASATTVADCTRDF